VAGWTRIPFVCFVERRILLLLPGNEWFLGLPAHSHEVTVLTVLAQILILVLFSYKFFYIQEINGFYVAFS
jgi:hypothetical protein